METRFNDLMLKEMYYIDVVQAILWTVRPSNFTSEDNNYPRTPSAVESHRVNESL